MLDRTVSFESGAFRDAYSKSIQLTIGVLAAATAEALAGVLGEYGKALASATSVQAASYATHFTEEGRETTDALAKLLIVMERAQGFGVDCDEAIREGVRTRACAALGDRAKWADCVVEAVHREPRVGRA
jgi:hypothetical protein